jgi:hypothetical protein
LRNYRGLFTIDKRRKEKGELCVNIFQDIKNKLEKSFEQAGHQSQRVVEMGRLNLRIKSKKDELAELVDQLGWAVFESWEPNEEFKLNPDIERALHDAYRTEKQLQKLEEEREKLKNSNIHTKVTAETVKLSLAGIETSGQQQFSTPTIYICSYCAHQMPSDEMRCPHCHK